jgi:hypothetical protein
MLDDLESPPGRIPRQREQPETSDANASAADNHNQQ